MRAVALFFLPLMFISCVQLPVQPVPPPPPSPPANVSGVWNSNTGHKYTIAQNGNNITWHVFGSNEVGHGTIFGKHAAVSWSGSQGSGTAKGKVTAIAPNGVAIAIKWDNGVAFFR